jgi:asparagine synthase (glutamine-hydrolysing)
LVQDNRGHRTNWNQDDIHDIHLYFSVAFDDPSFDESCHARLVARHVGTDHHEITLTPRMMLDLVPHVADFLDEPLGDSSIIPTYLLSQFTRQHVKVALGGDGGDELFAGYSTLQAHRLSDWIPSGAGSR